MQKKTTTVPLLAESRDEAVRPGDGCYRADTKVVARSLPQRTVLAPSLQHHPLHPTTSSENEAATNYGSAPSQLSEEEPPLGCYTPPLLHLPKTVLVFIYCYVVFVTGAGYYNWPPFSQLLYGGGAYAWVCQCEPVPAGASSGRNQAALLDNYYTRQPVLQPSDADAARVLDSAAGRIVKSPAAVAVAHQNAVATKLAPLSTTTATDDGFRSSERPRTGGPGRRGPQQLVTGHDGTRNRNSLPMNRCLLVKRNGTTPSPGDQEKHQHTTSDPLSTARFGQSAQYRALGGAASSNHAVSEHAPPRQAHSNGCRPQNNLLGPLCQAQKIELVKVYTLGFVVSQLSGILSGAYADLASPQVAAVSGSFLCGTGWYLLSRAALQETGGMYIAALVVIGASASLTGLPGNWISALFPQNSSLVLSLLSAAYDASSLVPIGLLFVWRRRGLDVLPAHELILGYVLVIVVPALFVSVVVYPPKSLRKPTPKPAQDGSPQDRSITAPPAGRRLPWTVNDPPVSSSLSLAYHEFPTDDYSGAKTTDSIPPVASSSTRSHTLWGASTTNVATWHALFGNEDPQPGPSNPTHSSIDPDCLACPGIINSQVLNCGPPLRRPSVETPYTNQNRCPSANSPRPAGWLTVESRSVSELPETIGSCKSKSPPNIESTTLKPFESWPESIPVSRSLLATGRQAYSSTMEVFQKYQFAQLQERADSESELTSNPSGPSAVCLLFAQDSAAAVNTPLSRRQSACSTSSDFFKCSWTCPESTVPNDDKSSVPGSCDSTSCCAGRWGECGLSRCAAPCLKAKTNQHRLNWTEMATESWMVQFLKRKWDCSVFVLRACHAWSQEAAKWRALKASDAIVAAPAKFSKKDCNHTALLLSRTRLTLAAENELGRKSDSGEKSELRRKSELGRNDTNRNWCNRNSDNDFALLPRPAITEATSGSKSGKTAHRVRFVFSTPQSDNKMPLSTEGRLQKLAATPTDDVPRTTNPVSPYGEAMFPEPQRAQGPKAMSLHRTFFHRHQFREGNHSITFGARPLAAQPPIIVETGTRQAAAEHCDFTSPNKKSWLWRSIFCPANPVQLQRRRYLLVGATFWQQFSSEEFFNFLVYFVICSLRSTFVNISVRDVLGEEPANLVGILTPLAFVPCLVFGHLADAFGVVTVSIILNTVGVWMYSTILLAPYCKMLANVVVVLYVIHSSFVYGQMIVFVSECFGMEHLGKFVGSATLIDGLLAALNSVFYTISIHTFNDNFLVINIFLLTLSIGCYLPLVGIIGSLGAHCDTRVQPLHSPI